MTTIGRILDNRYIIRAEIGSGGFGAVYLAEDSRFTGNNQVAIKKIQQKGEMTDRAFRHEANLLYNLSHPNLPKVTNCFQEIEANYIVMDFIRGADLMEQLKAGRQFAINEVLEIADTVLAALEYLHSFLIFHRDIKPHNIKVDETGKVFLLDFGTAKGQFNENTLSLTDQSITGYTPFYAPLEQVLRVDANSYLLLQSIDSANLEKFEQNKTDARSDIYSLGATLYHLLTGFSPERATATIRAHLIWSGKNDPLPDCRSYNPLISENLANIIEKCLAIDPEERFQTAAQLRNALKISPTAAEPTRENIVDVETPRTSSFINFNLPEPTEPAIVAPTNFKTNHVPSVKTNRNWLAYVGLATLALATLIVGGWFVLGDNREAAKTSATAGEQSSSAASSSLPAAKTTRRFVYSLLVQKMRDGKEFQTPFESSGQEIFESGYQFRLRFTAPDTGFVYIFNEGLDASGGKIFTVQFPTPSANNGNARVEANQNYQSSQLRFDGKPGTENFWIAWSRNEIESLEQSRADAFANKGVVMDANVKSKLKDYLENERRKKTESSKDAEKKLTAIDFEGDTLVQLIQLEHR